MEEHSINYNPKSITPTNVSLSHNVPKNSPITISRKYEQVNNDTIILDQMVTPVGPISFDFLSGCALHKEDFDNNIGYCVRKYKETDKFSAYPTFRDLLIDTNYLSKPHRDSRYATQGVCQINDTTFITSYDTGYDDKGIPFATSKERNSILDIKDNDGRTKTVRFDNTSHVGGVSFSSEHQTVYVSGPSGTLNIYDMQDIANTQDGGTLTNYTSVTLANHPSYLTVDENTLYAGLFKEEGPSVVSIYDLADDGKNIQFEKQIPVPFEQVQGMCVLNKNGVKYFVFTCSYGRQSDSKLVVATLHGDEFIPVKDVKLPCMAEQVSVDSDGNLMMVFESDCKKYGYQAYGSSTLIGNVVHLNTNKLLDIPHEGGGGEFLTVNITTKN